MCSSSGKNIAFNKWEKPKMLGASTGNGERRMPFQSTDHYFETGIPTHHGETTRAWYFPTSVNTTMKLEKEIGKT
jgi:hypothetical protein